MPPADARDRDKPGTPSWPPIELTALRVNEYSERDKVTAQNAAISPFPFADEDVVQCGAPYHRCSRSDD